MGIEYKAEISIPRPDAFRIIADHINEWFGTEFKPEDIRVRYDGQYDDQEFGGFYVTHNVENTRKGTKVLKKGEGL